MLARLAEASTPGHCEIVSPHTGVVGFHAGVCRPLVASNVEVGPGRPIRGLAATLARLASGTRRAAAEPSVEVHRHRAEIASSAPEADMTVGPYQVLGGILS